MPTEILWAHTLLPFVTAVACAYLLNNLVKNRSKIEFILLFSNLLMINSSQSIGYLLWPFFPGFGEFIADLYLIGLYFLFGHLTLVAFSLSGNNTPLKQRSWLYICPSILALLHMSGLMVEGYRFENNALLHDDGILAPAFDLFVLLSCFATASVLWRNIKLNKGNKFLVSKNLIALISFIPLLIVIGTIVLLSTTENAVPIIIIGPMIFLYTAYTFYYLSRDTVADISIGVGFFIDRIKLAYTLLEIHKTKTDLKSFNKAVEKQFIIEALKEHDYNIYKTAEHLEFNHTTLRNKIKEYEIDLEQNRENLSKNQNV